MANGRCKRHGGKSTGANNPARKLEADNGAYTHGVYTKYFRPEEKALIDEGAFRLGTVDTELTVMRVRLKRTLEAREAWEAAREAGTDATFQTLSETIDDQGVTKDGDVVDLVKTVKRIPNFDDIIDRTLARIESLEKTRKELLKDGDGDDPPDGEGGTTRDRVTFTGGLDGGNDDELPSPFAPKAK